MKNPFRFLLLILQVGILFGQETPAGVGAPPSGPLFRNRAPEMSTWTVSRRLGEVSPGTGNEAASIDAGDVVLKVVKTGKIYRASVGDGRGRTHEVWSDGSIVAVEADGGADAQFVAPPADHDAVNPLYQSFARADFDGFEWIASKNFRGTRKVQDRECLVFSETVRTLLEPAPGEKGPGRESVEEREALIDAASRLPVILRNANGIFTYQFLPPPETMQALPASVVALVEKRRQIERTLTGRTVKPF